MTMDESQIVVEYKTAKKPEAQIKVLAELNNCKEADICRILLAHPESGFKQTISAPKRQYNRKPKTEPPQTAPAAKPVKSLREVPPEVMTALAGFAASLHGVTNFGLFLSMPDVEIEIFAKLPD